MPKRLMLKAPHAKKGPCKSYMFIYMFVFSADFTAAFIFPPSFLCLPILLEHQSRDWPIIIIGSPLKIVIDTQGNLPERI